LAIITDQQHAEMMSCAGNKFLNRRDILCLCLLVRNLLGSHNSSILKNADNISETHVFRDFRDNASFLLRFGATRCGRLHPPPILLFRSRSPRQRRRPSWSGSACAQPSAYSQAKRRRRTEERS
jgi:hypothetical protein